MRRAFVLLAVAACVAPGFAGTADEPEVPVFTNADLERMFGTPSGPDAPLDSAVPESWDFVQEFLDRQWARLDSERAFDLTERAEDRRDRTESERRARWIAPYQGIYGAWWSMPYRYPRPVHSARAGGAPTDRPPHGSSRPSRPGRRDRAASGLRHSHASRR